MPLTRSSYNLVWLDLETTGLDVETRTILEIATLVTDKDLNVLAEGPDLVLHHAEDVLIHMDEWCREQHAASGLLKAVRDSDVSLEEAERRTLAFLEPYCPPQSCPLCGNSICFDRRFLIRYMPKLNAHLNYRNIDVSSIKELAYRWYPQAMKQVEKEAAHRAMDDIRESLDELRLYRRLLFKELHV